MIHTLQVSRIEHGVRAIEDQTLMSELVRAAITLDICPTSKVKLRVVKDIAVHPIRPLHRRIRVTVGTDNPMILGCTLTSELRQLVDWCGFSFQDLAQLQRNAFRVARISAPDREAMLAEIAAVMTRFANPGGN